MAVTTNAEQYMKCGEHKESRNEALNLQLQEARDLEAALKRQIERVTILAFLKGSYNLP